MTNEEIQKLVSGYATNSLTDTERKALFEAALDDQELFDILQREQAVKDVLDDPVSRRQVREALETSTPVATPSWWVRWSTWGFATAAVAAVLTVAVIFKTEHPATQQRTFEIAKADRPAAAEAQPPSTGPAVELRAPEPKPMRRLDALKTAPTKQPEKDSDASLMKAAPEKQDAAPPPAAQVEAQVQSQAVQSQAVPQQQAFNDQARVAAPTVRNAVREEQSGQRAAAAPRQALTAGYAGLGGAAQGPLLSYSLVKRDESGNFVPAGTSAALRKGDGVRINVVPLAPGYLTLYELDSTGNWVQLSPGIKVSPNRTYTLPDSPIEVKADQHLRLVLTPEPGDKRPPSSVEITLQ